jgi:hypothetical protein
MISSRNLHLVAFRHRRLLLNLESRIPKRFLAHKSATNIAVPDGESEPVRFKQSITHDDDLKSSAKATAIPSAIEDIDDYQLAEDDEAFLNNKIAKALLRTTKAPWKQLPPLPDWFLTRQQSICEHRTIPQIQRSLQSWMIHQNLPRENEYRNKPVGWITDEDNLLEAENKVSFI